MAGRVRACLVSREDEVLEYRFAKLRSSVPSKCEQISTNPPTRRSKAIDQIRKGELDKGPSNTSIALHRAERRVLFSMSQGSPFHWGCSRAPSRVVSRVISERMCRFTGSPNAIFSKSLRWPTSSLVNVCADLTATNTDVGPNRSCSVTSTTLDPGNLSSSCSTSCRDLERRVASPKVL
jgi:hypothetical protein